MEYFVGQSLFHPIKICATKVKAAHYYLFKKMGEKSKHSQSQVWKGGGKSRKKMSENSQMMVTSHYRVEVSGFDDNTSDFSEEADDSDEIQASSSGEFLKNVNNNTP